MSIQTAPVCFKYTIMKRKKLKDCGGHLSEQISHVHKINAKLITLNSPDTYQQIFHQHDVQQQLTSVYCFHYNSITP